MTTQIWSGAEVGAFNQAVGSGPCLAMYRSHWDAIVREPGWMNVPVDDHLVHRGDGVFETLLCEEGAVYNLSGHLDRLERSAAFVSIPLPMSRRRLEEVVVDTFRAAGERRSLARLLLGRGGGGFSVDPGEAEGASVYVMVYRAPPRFMARVPEGARLILSRMPVKPAGLATVKTCNYLPNALMKAEAGNAGAHFALGVDPEGFLTESFTENLAGVDREGRLVVPPPLHHLAGTTLARVVELARERGWGVDVRRLRPEELFDLREVWIVGTTAYVTRAVSLAGRALPTGPLAAEMERLLVADIARNPAMRTPVFDPVG